jgi:hypothetical protein
LSRGGLGKITNRPSTPAQESDVVDVATWNETRRDMKPFSILCLPASVRARSTARSRDSIDTLRADRLSCARAVDAEIHFLKKNLTAVNVVN